MKKDHLTALLAVAEASAAEGGWTKLPEGKHMTLYAAFNGASLTVSRIESAKVEGELVHLRTQRGEVYLVALADVFAGAVEEPAGNKGRKAGFV
jgi:hypothetical protein